MVYQSTPDGKVTPFMMVYHVHTVHQRRFLFFWPLVWLLLLTNAIITGLAIDVDMKYYPVIRPFFPFTACASISFNPLLFVFFTPCLLSAFSSSLWSLVFHPTRTGPLHFFPVIPKRIQWYFTWRICIHKCCAVGHPAYSTISPFDNKAEIPVTQAPKSMQTKL